MDPLGLDDTIRIVAHGCSEGGTKVTDGNGNFLYCDYGGGGGGGGVPSPVPGGPPDRGGRGPAPKKKPPCAGKTITVNPNLRVSSDANGAINSVGVRLTGDQQAMMSQPGSLFVSIPPDTWVGATLNADGSLSAGFSNPVFIKPEGLGSITGAFVSSADFNNGSFTQVNGAVAIEGVPIGSTTTPSTKLKNDFNDNSQLANALSLLQDILKLLNSILNCDQL